MKRFIGDKCNVLITMSENYSKTSKSITLDKRAYEMLAEESRERYGTTGYINAILVEVLRKGLNIDVMAEVAHEEVNLYTDVEVEANQSQTQRVNLKTSERLMGEIEKERGSGSFSQFASQSVLYYFAVRDQLENGAIDRDNNKDVDFERIRENWTLSGSVADEVDFEDVPKSPQIRRPLELAFLKGYPTYLSQNVFVNIMADMFEVSKNTTKRDLQALIDEKRIYVGCEVDNKISLDLDYDGWETVVYPSEKEFEQEMQNLLRIIGAYTEHKEERGKIIRDNEQRALNTLQEIETKCSTYAFTDLESEAKELAQRISRLGIQSDSRAKKALQN